MGEFLIMQPSKNKSLEGIEIAVIIPCFNDVDRLNLCLDALSKQTLNSQKFTVIVVDNGSDIYPTVATDLYPNVHLLSESKPGSYNARNKGIASIESEFYAFTDADCIPEKTWLEESLNAVKNQEIDAIGGPIHLFSIKEDAPTPFELLDILSGFQQHKSVKKLLYTPTANLVTKSKTFEKIGYFNGSLMSGGDKEWCQRLNNSGGTLLYVQNATVNHPARASAIEYYTKIRRLAHGMWARKNTDPTIKSYLGIKGLVSCITPPINRWKSIFNDFPDIPLSTKIKAAFYLYTVKFYSQYQIQLCRFGLIKIAERK